MSKEKYLTKAEKELIAILYKRKLSIGKIAYVLGRHRRTVFNYKNYKIFIVTRKKETKEMYDASKEQLIFQMFYDECKKGNRFYPESVSLLLIHGKKGQPRYYHLRKFEKLPRYKNKSRQEIIKDVTDIIFKRMKHKQQE